MTRTQLFVTLSLVICATTPCADGMSAATEPGPIVPDALWRGAYELHAFVTASLLGSTPLAAGLVLATVFAWRCRSLALALLARRADGRRWPSCLRTIVGGLPASGVAGGVPLRPQPPLPSPPRPSPRTGARLARHLSDGVVTRSPHLRASTATGRFPLR